MRDVACLLLGIAAGMILLPLIYAVKRRPAWRALSLMRRHRRPRA